MSKTRTLSVLEEGFARHLASLSESAYLFITRDRADDDGRTEFCLTYATDDGLQEIWLTYEAYHRIAAATREGLDE